MEAAFVVVVDLKRFKFSSVRASLEFIVAGAAAPFGVARDVVGRLQHQAHELPHVERVVGELGVLPEGRVVTLREAAENGEKNFKYTHSSKITAQSGRKRRCVRPAPCIPMKMSELLVILNCTRKGTSLKDRPGESQGTCSGGRESPLRFSGGGGGAGGLRSMFSAFSVATAAKEEMMPSATKSSIRSNRAAIKL
ncbi:hypothetical protein EYF80_048404 [Liparis tanakae]|uniref:Uncharacterized protein n=1 Tax=Liparis tanakae TaxID=230148 RepID=A0A4Z2FMC2_9TELE|nr:hypothetical protein EYF80_048404 [Liparis tanakae]